MRRISIYLIIATVALTLCSVQNAQAISRTTRTINFVEFFGGSSMAQGTVTGLPDYDFIINNALADIDANDVYDKSIHLGFKYGQLRGSHLLLSFAFKYTKHDVNLIIPLTVDTLVLVDSSTNYNQFDIGFDLNYMISDITTSTFAPYIGAGFQAGLLSISGDFFETQNEAIVSLSLNFGGDLKVWSASDGLSHLTLSSTNSYDYYGSNQKPKYLNVGLGLKYYFRP